MHSAAELCWPDLSAPYAEALRAVVHFVLERYDPVGIVASGSIVRGNPGPTSDLDTCVIHEAPWRQRVQRFFDGVPAEIFVNSPAAIRHYFESEHAEGRPSTAHMLASGFVVLARTPVVDQLRREAGEWLARPPALSEGERLWQRYAVVDTLDNAADLAEEDPDNARLVLNTAIQQMIEYAFRADGRFIPRAKERLTRLHDVDPSVEQLVRRVIAEPQISRQLELAQQAAARITGQATFFEWESARQEFPPPSGQYRSTHRPRKSR